MNKTKLLYVEDEHSLANIVKDVLEGRGYEVCLVSDGAKVLDTHATFKPDLCVLDIMLPNVDGYTLGKELKKRNPDTPIIFLSAKNQPADVIKGFKNGGSDYLRKPFSIEELLVRMENQLMQKPKTTKERSLDQNIQLGPFTFHPFRLVLAHPKQDRRLTHREAELLKFFSNHKNGVVNKKELLLAVWGDDSLYNVRNLDVYINKAREMFSIDPAVEIITLRGLGYRFNID